MPSTQIQQTGPVAGTLCQMIATVLTVIALLAVTPASAAQAGAQVLAARYGDTAHYAITRKGKRIGTHTLDFARTNDLLEVNVTSKIRVTVLKIPVFSFDYRATEKWQGDELISVIATTTENSTTTRVQLQSTADRSVVTLPDGRTTTVPRVRHASNHWYAGVINATTLFNTINGKTSRITVAPVADEYLTIGPETVKTNRYRYSGNINADIWFDTNGRWIKLAFKGEDGSNIEYRLLANS